MSFCIIHPRWRTNIKRPSARPDLRAASNGRQGGRAAGGRRSRLPCRWQLMAAVKSATPRPALPWGFRRLRCLEARRFPLASGLDAGPFRVKAPHQGPAALTSLFVFLTCDCQTHSYPGHHVLPRLETAPPAFSVKDGSIALHSSDRDAPGPGRGGEGRRGRNAQECYLRLMWGRVPAWTVSSLEHPRRCEMGRPPLIQANPQQHERGSRIM
jgi:hypothetical protein